MKYRTEQNGNLITLWDDNERVGIQFKQGEILQRYTLNVMVIDTPKLSTLEGINAMNKATEALITYAEKHYPHEFQHIAE